MFWFQVNVISTKQPLRKVRSYLLCRLLSVCRTTESTPSEPTRASILAELIRLENDGVTRMAPNDHSDAALWINEGLELEESQ